MGDVEKVQPFDLTDSQDEGYDAADNAYKCWELAIRLMREKLEAQQRAEETPNG